MNVRFFEQDRYLVGSEKAEEEPYLVDLSEFDGNGWCNCRDFECRHQPTLTREIEGQGHILSHRRCKHILLLLEHLKSGKV